ncbi:uncharacterized protein VP01_2201g2 [Puccinia sorghi]|uniref:BED-type domain-containing protein n=1 Tax=Puccinia sorghi TaxID=27349 RepID=A0A0L6VAT1_9BASI|nr:uncharacterized protein VP01_2201g2 [Puccinia sorghi]
MNILIFFFSQPHFSPFPLQLPWPPLTIQPTTQTTLLISPAQSTPTHSATPQQSWVWTYFESKLDKVQCTVPGQSSKPCGKLLTCNKTQSTKSMIKHLSCMHKSDNSKKIDKHQTFITNLKQKHIECRRLIATLINSADLPFSFVKDEAFLNLLEIVNPHTSNMICKRKTSALKVSHLYIGYHKQLKKLLGSFKDIGYTLDAWTSPNKIAFMAITAQVMSPDLEIIFNILVALPVIYGV